MDGTETGWGRPAEPGPRWRALLDRARQDPAVTTFRATVSPDNAASRDLVLSEGLVEVGEQQDDEDGVEIVYELAVDHPRSGPA